jgi:chemotaxis signal transduction protein
MTSQGESVEAVFRQRALDLAARRGRDGKEKAAEVLPVLAFLLGEDRYGLPLTALAGVVPFTACTFVPGGPAELVGVINHRGQVCSVLDLALLLGLPALSSSRRPGARAEEQRPAHPTSAEGRTRPGYILLLRRRSREIGLLIDQVESVVRVVPGGGVAAPEEAGTPLVVSVVSVPGAGAEASRVRLLRAEVLLSHPLLTSEG